MEKTAQGYPTKDSPNTHNTISFFYHTTRGYKKFCNSPTTLSRSISLSLSIKSHFSVTAIIDFSSLLCVIISFLLFLYSVIFFFNFLYLLLSFLPKANFVVFFLKDFLKDGRNEGSGRI
jgi:hypothetical protein